MKCDGCGENGLSGDLRIIYDVERPHSKGEIMVCDRFAGQARVVIPFYYLL